jgi:hypothetical protein
MRSILATVVKAPRLKRRAFPSKVLRPRWTKSAQCRPASRGDSENTAQNGPDTLGTVVLHRAGRHRHIVLDSLGAEM